MINCYGTCVDPSTSRTYCGATSEDCRLNICSSEKNEICLNGNCDCAPGSKRCEYDICVSMKSVEHCGDCEVNCLQIDGWKQGECLDGRCVLTACSDGYHAIVNEEDMMRCELDSVEKCGDQQADCRGEFVNASDIRCAGGVCDYSCASGYHKYEKACEADDLENCGEHGTACAVGHATNRCESGGCTFSCDNGFHTSESGTACTSDNLDNCGGSPCDKEKIAHGEAFICNNGVCEVEVCDSGYHVYNNSCEPDDLDNCGGHEEKCRIDNGTGECSMGKCTLVSCSPGYHGYLNACEPDSPENCGNHGSVCTIMNGTPSCPAGTCLPGQCDNGYHVFDNTCEINSTSHCGAHGIECNVANAANACSQAGVCSYECYEGYHEKSGTCERDECSNGHTRCTNTGTNGARQVCGGGVWGTAETCSGNHSCKSDGSECGECVDGEKGCTGATPRSCSGGAWKNGTTCTAPSNGNAICNAGSCSYSCNSGFTDNGATCCPNVVNGTITHDGLESCNFACNDGYHKSGGTCVKNDCTNNAKRCNGRIPQTCIGGVWTGSTECGSTEVCRSNSCTACESGTHVSGNSCVANECSGTTTICTNTGTTGYTQTCSGGVWGAQQACSGNTSCNQAGTACGACVNNAKKCSGLTPQTCTNGAWKDGSVCEAPLYGTATCSGGSCGYSCNSGYTDNGAYCCSNVANGSITLNSSSSCDFKCNSGYCKYQRTCLLPNETVACGSSCTDCTQSFEHGRSYACNYGTCMVTECEKGYYVKDNRCVESTSCGDDNSNYIFYTPPEGERVKAYCIKTASDLQLVRTRINSGKHYPDENTKDAFVIAKDIKVSEWKTSIGTISYPFRGIIANDSGSIQLNNATTGLIGYAENAQLDSLKLTVAMDVSVSPAGGLINEARDCLVIMSDVTITIKNGLDNVGGMIGLDKGSKILYSRVNSSGMNGGGVNMGGMIGYASGSTITYGTVSINKIESSKDCVGGVAGLAEDSQFSYTKSTVNIGSPADAGGFVGKMSGGRAENCVSISTMSCSGANCGGFVGKAENSAYYETCAALGGSVNSYNTAGGFVGLSKGGVFSNCLNANSVSGYTLAGGFAGNNSEVKMWNSYSFTKLNNQSGKCYYLAPTISYPSPSTVGSNYYYKDGCNGSNCVAGEDDKPIVMSGSEMTQPYQGNMSCELLFGTFRLYIPNAIMSLVGGVCS